MRKLHTFLFDLDGTLTDSGSGITNSVFYALKKYGITETDPRILQKFIGPPLTDSFIQYYGFSKETALEAVDFYREYYAEKGIYENSLYPGVKEMLSRLKEGGATLCVATSKPEPFTEKILRHFGLREYFDFVGGALMDETRTKKADVIRYVLESINAKDPQGIAMVGDRSQDISGAAENNIFSIGVLYGYGDLNELTSAGANLILSSPEEIILFERG